MRNYRTVPLPTGAADASRTELAAGIVEWMSSCPLRDLVSAFGGDLPSGDGPGALIDWLDRFSATHWDYRSRAGGVERDAVSALSFPAPVAELVLAASTALGMVLPRAASVRAYQHLLVLGGLARSCLDRTGYAARLVQSGAVTVNEVAALGSFRPLHESETTELGLPGSGYELDAMELGIRAAFGCGEPDETRSSDGEVNQGSWATRNYRPTGGPRVRVLAAPSSEPATRRAHTSDTYHFWARQVFPSAGDRVLVVTNSIYVPFQHCDAINTLGLSYGCGVETIGLDPALLVEGQPAQCWSTDRYLQEIRSAIRAMGNLFAALDRPADH